MEDANIIIVLTIGIGFLGLLTRFCFKSKCDRVNVLWGCLRIHREVEQEAKDIEKNAPDDQSQEK